MNGLKTNSQARTAMATEIASGVSMDWRVSDSLRGQLSGAPK